MSKTLATYIIVAIVTLAGHYALNAQRHMTHSEFLLKAAEQKEKIQTDQIRELIADLQNAKQKNDSMRTEGYVAGVSDAVNKPDHYMAIWHNGYDRGTAVQMDVMNAGLKMQDKFTTEEVGSNKGR